MRFVPLHLVRLRPGGGYAAVICPE